jgi:hypothetical protein
MALKSGTPVNLSALRQDYSALPQIAAVKAQANQQLFNTISEGIEKRKQKKIEADEKASNIRVIERVLNSPLGERVFGQDRPSAEDVYSSMGKGGQGELVKLLTTMQNAEIAQTEEQRRLALLKAEQLKARKEAIFEDVRTNFKGQAQTETGAFRATPEVISRVAEDYKGILAPEEVAAIGADLTKEYNLRGRELIQKFSKDDPQFEEYLTALSKLPEDTKLQRDLFGIKSGLDLIPMYAITKAIRNYFQGKQEFEAGPFDLESIEKYNERIRRNPEIAQAAGLPERLYDLIKSGRMSEEVQEKKEVNLDDGTSVYIYGNPQAATALGSF